MELKARGLKKVYRSRVVVQNMDLQVTQGEIVGLLGPNGAGKTTSFYMIVGLVRAEEGKITLGDEDVTHFPLHKRALKGLGYLPQEASVFRHLTVEENIYAVLENTNLSPRQRSEKTGQLMDDFGLSHLAKSMGISLSGGERRRVEIARALALSPQFILLDEPFAGVDPIAVAEIKEIIRRLKSRNIGVLITDHNVRETLAIVDRAYIMNAGEVLISGLPDEIVKDERARKLYLGEEFKM